MVSVICTARSFASLHDSCLPIKNAVAAQSYHGRFSVMDRAIAPKSVRSRSSDWCLKQSAVLPSQVSPMTGFHQRAGFSTLTAPDRAGICTPFPCYIPGATSRVPQGHTEFIFYIVPWNPEKNKSIDGHFSQMRPDRAKAWPACATVHAVLCPIRQFNPC